MRAGEGGIRQQEPRRAGASGGEGGIHMQPEPIDADDVPLVCGAAVEHAENLAGGNICQVQHEAEGAGVGFADAFVL